jgi:hypothetical protein
MLALLAVMLAGSVMAATASAEPGPFWHHRAIGGEGEGAKIEPAKPENFKGGGGVQTLKGEISGTPIEITSSQVQIKGAIFNLPSQGQIKLEIVYNQPTLVKPVLKGCTVTVGPNNSNIVQIKGHLMWKWDGSEKQLTEQPQEHQKWDIGFTAIEPQQGETELKRGTFTVVNFTGSGCGVLASKVAVTGSAVGIPSPSQLKEWSTSLAVRTVDVKKIQQHFWDGKEFQGTKLGLNFGPNEATLIGQTNVTAEQQEVAVFEK